MKALRFIPYHCECGYALMSERYAQSGLPISLTCLNEKCKYYDKKFKYPDDSIELEPVE